MIHSLELENFKAFGARARIPFAPITLIFGENSAGKTTILQALNLLKQTRESREAGALLLPRAENGIVDLGSFQELLFDHDLKRTLAIRVETTVDERDLLRLPSKNNKIAIEFSFKRPSLEEEVLLDQIGIYDGKSAKCIAKFQPPDTTEGPEKFWRRMRFLPPYLPDLPPSELPIVECVWLTKEPEYWKPEFEWCKANKEEILDLFKRNKAHSERSLKHLIAEEKEMNEQKGSDKASQESKKEWYQRQIEYSGVDLKFFSSDFDLKTYISVMHKKEMNTSLRVQGFLPSGSVALKRNHQIRESRSLRSGPFDRPPDDTETFDAAEFALTARRALERTLKVLFPMGPFRGPPERWYIFRGTSPQDVGYRGSLLPDLLLRRPKLVTETNEWLERLDIGYELEVKPVGTDTGDLFEVRLIDTRRKARVNVALPDVGFGISQLLPFVVQSLVSEGQIISIEQPEVHVHPKLQADLGDLLAEAIKPPRRNQFIVETHSEHLILRLQRLVREKHLKPTDISVIYVSRGPEGAESQRLHLDEDGDFIDEWPNGFFAERLREL